MVQKSTPIITNLCVVKLTLEYDGTHYYGWQRQENGPSIQQEIESVLTQSHSRPMTIYGAGRTDSGVHAKAQVAHFYSEKKLTAIQWQCLLNSELPQDIRVINVEFLGSDFHSQKNAIGKIYEYRVLHRAFSSALDRRALFYNKPLDWAAIERSLHFFVGTKDFVSFQGAKAQVKTTVRTVRRFELFKESTHVYRFEIEGTGFLKQMVRNIIGTLIEVGEGKRTPDSIATTLQSHDRRNAGRTAPAHGLCLVEVKY